MHLRDSVAAEINGKAMMWPKYILGSCHSATITTILSQCSIMESDNEYMSNVNIGREFLESYSCGPDSQDEGTSDLASKVMISALEIMVYYLIKAHRALGQLDEALRVAVPASSINAKRSW